MELAEGSEGPGSPADCVYPPNPTASKRQATTRRSFRRICNPQRKHEERFASSSISVHSQGACQRGLARINSSNLLGTMRSQAAIFLLTRPSLTDGCAGTSRVLGRT